jgi:hypothetical protein
VIFRRILAIYIILIDRFAGIRDTVLLTTIRRDIKIVSDILGMSAPEPPGLGNWVAPARFHFVAGCSCKRNGCLLGYSVFFVGQAALPALGTRGLARPPILRAIGQPTSVAVFIRGAVQRWD